MSAGSTSTAATLLEEDLPSRYIVGIDLGTTNSAVTFVDTQKKNPQLTPFATAQITAPGQIESRDTLPSFHYQAANNEFAADAFRLPWHKNETTYCVGPFARDHGVAVPGRVIGSAKSWLSHSGVDRTAALLPWQGAAVLEKLSPVQVSSRLLEHIRQSWNEAHKNERLEDQDIVLTLPASFDEIARELTVQAAAEAGLKRIVLIEEPQAAFYAWLDNHDENWDQLVEPGQTILVCDIGGGTSDFTLIRVRRGEDDKVQFHRVAVGEHLILGGDNLDLTLAHHFERKLSNSGKLTPQQWSSLVRRCRQVKETLLAEDAPDSYQFSLPGSGSKLIGSNISIEVTKAEVEQILLEGFLPECEVTDTPEQRQSGFQEFGLPYAQDPAITRWLGAFLTSHSHVVENDESGHQAVRPDLILFNGGFFESSVLRDRLLKIITSWFADSSEANWQPQVLSNQQLDLAVSRGAAYYGRVRRGEGVRITANLARTYYIGVGDNDHGQAQALCLLPATTQPGEEIDWTEKSFQLKVSQPVEFPLYISSTRLIDQAGELITIDAEQMKSLPPIRTVLRVSRRSEAETITVNLHAKLTEIGTIELWCTEQQSDRSWRLQFDVRSATQTDVMAHTSAKEAEGVIDEASFAAAAKLLEETFTEAGTHKPQKLIRELETALEMSRGNWPTSLLRRLWELLMDLEHGRRKSSTHEARWLNLLGYSLRPGYGLALDDWRVSETWKVLQGRVIHKDDNCRTQSWILWRRIAGGLNRGQQQAVAEPLIQSARSLHRRLTTGQGGGIGVTYTPQESIEAWRLLGSLELLDSALKTSLGNMLCDLLGKKKLAPARSAMAWAIGRLGSRTPLYGPLNTVISTEVATRWLSTIRSQKETDPMDLLAMMQIARKTDDRYRDLSEPERQTAAKWLTQKSAPQHFREMILTGGTLDHEEQQQVFGESLPVGLTLSV